MPRLPSVNLLPPDVLEILRLRTLRAQFLAAGLVVLVCLGALYVVQSAQLGTANERLTAEQDRGQVVAAEKARLAPVAAFFAEVGLTQQLIMETMTKEVLFSDVGERLTIAATGTVTLATVSMTAVTAELAEPAAAPVVCPGSDPFNQIAVVGCITVAGTADSRESVGQFVVNILAEERFLSPFVSTTVLDEETGTVAFTGTISLTGQVYAGRYNDVEFLAQAPE
ncbi:MAG: hypothetical protein H0V67_04055 [Geodermatophilaceae bacterium]|nr:hypothetical protein [Geodermatophilaceae bacterium]